MYTLVNRRKYNPERLQETMQRGKSEFFPKLQAAPGLVGFYLVHDEKNEVNVAISVWNDKASADAFQPEAQAWMQVLDQMGHHSESHNEGDTVMSVHGQR